MAKQQKSNYWKFIIVFVLFMIVFIAIAYFVNYKNPNFIKNTFNKLTSKEEKLPTNIINKTEIHITYVNKTVENITEVTKKGSGGWWAFWILVGFVVVGVAYYFIGRKSSVVGIYSLSKCEEIAKKVAEEEIKAPVKAKLWHETYHDKAEFPRVGFGFCFDKVIEGQNQELIAKNRQIAIDISMKDPKNQQAVYPHLDQSDWHTIIRDIGTGKKLDSHSPAKPYMDYDAFLAGDEVAQESASREKGALAIRKATGG